MNCLIWVLLLLCCGNNTGCCNDHNDGCGGRNQRRSAVTNHDCGCGNDGFRGRNEHQEDHDCGCRTEFRSEPRFEQRPFTFNQNAGCGCEEQPSNCDR